MHSNYTGLDRFHINPHRWLIFLAFFVVPILMRVEIRFGNIPWFAPGLVLFHYLDALSLH